MSDTNILIAKDIVASISPSFNGDPRLAAVAFQRIFMVIRKYDDDEAKLATKDIVVAMGSQLKGNIDITCDAFERILASVIIAKKTSKAPTTRQDVQIIKQEIPITQAEQHPSG